MSLLKIADEDKLFESWKSWKQNKNDEKLSQLLNEAEPIIGKAITSYAGKEDPVINLHAKRLARKAFDKYDPSKGASLKTYIMSSLRPLSRKVHERAQEFQMPQQTYFDLKNMKNTIEEYKSKHKTDPSMRELADKTGLSIKRLEKLKKFDRQNVPLSVLREANIEDFFEPGSEEEDSFWAEAVYHSLDNIDQKIWDMRLGRYGDKDDKYSVKEIARELGVSEPAVSQRITKIVNELERGVRYEK